jgi:predicted nucleic acid-binding protein
VTLWLLDASVLLAREDIDDVNHGSAQRLLDGTDPVATLDLAFYEVGNVAIRVWRDPVAGVRLIERVAAIADDGGLVRVDGTLLTSAAEVAASHGITVFDATYVVAAERIGAELVSCDVRDLVSRHLARLPADTVQRAAPG